MFLNIILRRGISIPIISCGNALLIKNRPLRLYIIVMDDQKPYCVDYAKRGTAGCKKCKNKLEKGILRLGKVVPNPFTDSGGVMKQWYHLTCMFEMLSRARPTTKKIESSDDLEGWEVLTEDDKESILKNIQSGAPTQSSSTSSKAPAKKVPTPSKKLTTVAIPSTSSSSQKSPTLNTENKDNSFREFRRICAMISNESSYKNKSAILSDYFEKGSSRDGFEGDILLWVRMLIPGVVKRVYNLQSKQLIKLFSQILDENHDEMMEDLENGDVAETIGTFYEKSTSRIPTKKSTLSLFQVDEFLQQLATLTKEEEQQRLFTKITKRCTANDLKIIIRLVKHDLRINAGAKHILDGVHPSAYEAFQMTRDIESVIRDVMDKMDTHKKKLTIQASVMTPVLPMLAEACKSLEYTKKKCPNGMFAEIKYDGERVQVHKNGNEFKYFSRSLKPVLNHKVAHFKEFIPKAFPGGSNLILDSEILLIDTVTGNPLPFGTLGKHKKTAFQNANVCLFVFDCLHYNGEDLMNMPLCERKDILEKNMTEIPNHIMFSEKKLITELSDLRELIMDVLNKGLEGLVLKDVKSIYEPGKRHWLKVKKDYLEEGSMADSADLVVLGAWYGTGHKGGMMSVFLMGCYDSMRGKWCSVSKVHTGIDDATLDKLQTKFKPLMKKISRDVTLLPNWFICNKPMVPDFVAIDPKSMPVWEITGAEFTKNNIHTADGLSIRFPRVTKFREDKTWKESTNMKLLNDLYRKSKDNPDVVLKELDKSDSKKEEAKKVIPKKNATGQKGKLENYFTKEPGTSQKRSHVTDSSPSEDDESPKKKFRDS